MAIERYEYGFTKKGLLVNIYVGDNGEFEMSFQDIRSEKVNIDSLTLELKDWEHLHKTLGRLINNLKKSNETAFMHF